MQQDVQKFKFFHQLQVTFYFSFELQNIYWYLFCIATPKFIGRVIGAREIRIGSDKVSIARLIVKVISGLQLNISPDNAIENGYISETTVTRRLTAQYQVNIMKCLLLIIL